MIPIDTTFDFKKVLATTQELDAKRDQMIEEKSKRGWKPATSTTELDEVFNKMREESGIPTEE